MKLSTQLMKMFQVGSEQMFSSWKNLKLPKHFLPVNPDIQKSDQIKGCHLL